MIKINIIGTDHSTGRGVGVYAQNLIKALAKLPDVEITDKDPDILHYSFFDLFYPTLPLMKKKPTVVSIHDLTPLVMPKRYPKGLKGSIAVLHQWLALQNVSAIVTDSENSKTDIIKYFHISNSKIFVTPLAVDSLYSQIPSKSTLEEIKKKYNLPDRFVLTVSAGPNPNKNLPALCEVTKRLNIPLVIVGKGMRQELKEPVHPELIDLIAVKKYDNVIIPPFVPNEDLLSFYHLATLYCQASLYEGFGLPVLEAMTAGCLIVSSNTSSLPEIYHSSAITFDPSNLASMESSLSKALNLTESEKKEQIDEGLKRSKDFDWEKTAKLTLEVYQKII